MKRVSTAYRFQNGCYRINRYFAVFSKLEAGDRLSACVVAARQTSAGYEVLMMQRSFQASFMPGACVFPGGTYLLCFVIWIAMLAGCLEEADFTLAAAIATSSPQSLSIQDLALKVCSLRELYEEAGLDLVHQVVHPQTTQRSAEKLLAQLHAR